MVTAVVYAVGVAVIDPVPVTRVGGVVRLAPPTDRGDADVIPSVLTSNCDGSMMDVYGVRFVDTLLTPPPPPPC